MIKEILPLEKCAECKGCCFFDSSDMWEVPYIMPELAGHIKDNYSTVELTETDGAYKFKLPEKLKEKELYVCPMLSEKGCILGDKKPFDCRIYPFRIMKDKNGEERIAVSEYCENISKMPPEKIIKFLKSSGLYEKITEYKNNYPFVVIEYTEGYKIIL